MALHQLRSPPAHLLLGFLLAVTVASSPAIGARLITLPSDDLPSNGLQSDDLPPSDLFTPKETIETLKPLIGILSQPGDGDGYEIMKKHTHPDSNAPTNISYIAASYVKFVEAGGARAVPIIYNEPEEQLVRKFKAINGLLIPGGGAKKGGPFLARVKRLLQLAMAANDEGGYFPIHAVCLGFEMLTMIVSEKGEAILSGYQAQRPSALHFVGEWAKTRNMFAWMTPSLVEKLGREAVAMENHMFGLAPETFSTNRALSSFFTVLTTSRDELGKEYVSTMEAKKYPFTAVQWHPEKNAFEWGNEFIPHTAEAIQVTQASTSFFANEARKSMHKPSSKEEANQLLIYNYAPYFSGKDGDGHFDQSYVFQCSDEEDFECLLDS